MGDDSLILREDGYIHMNFPVTSLTYHSNLNIILVKTFVGGVHVLDVNSGVILQSSCLSADEGGALGVEYAPGADRVFLWDSSGVGARTDYNGVLLLHTVLQRPLPSSQPDKIIRIELVLSEAVLLYQCLESLDAHSIEGLTDFITELKNAIDAEPVRKGVKAQKWSTVIIRLPQSTVRLVTAGVVQELKGQNRRIPALAIASAVGQRANELVPCSRDEETRLLMYSEAERKETFKRWPHMDYKWALPARMAQAGFYHQPTPSGDDRAMCFTCLVCLVCWEKSDEPWVEHERHSPNCPFVRGEYTHNVPISVTNATACAVPSPNVTVVSKGNTGDLIAAGTAEGKVNIWQFECGLKLAKFIHLSPYDSIFSGIFSTDCNKVWSTSLEKDSSTYDMELTAMSFVSMVSQQEPYPQAQNAESTEKETPTTTKTKPSLICAVTITRTSSSPSNQPIEEDSSKALFDSGVDKSEESVQAMNDQNEAKSNLVPTNKMLFLLTYDIHNSSGGSATTVIHTSNSSGNSKPGGSKKVCTVARKDDTNIYDEIYFQYSDEDTELPPGTSSLINDQISNVINLNASSSKEDCKIWEPKKIIFMKHFKVPPPPPPTALLPELPESGQGYGPGMLDFVGKISQLKSWKSGNLESVGTKLADQTDAVLQQADPITHYLNMNGPLEISDLKWYEGGDGTGKVKVTTFGGSKVKTQTVVGNSNNDGFDSDPPQEEVVSQGVAIQCLALPSKLILNDDSKVTHLLPTEDKEHLLVVVSSIVPEKVKIEEELDTDGDTKMEVDEVAEQCEKESPDAKAYFILYKINNTTSVSTLEDNPVFVKELPYNESPLDLCLLPMDKHDQYSFAVVSVDGSLRLYSLPDFRMLTEKRVPKEQFTSVTFCASVDRLSVSTKHGIIYFYALNNGERDSTGDVDEDEFANIDFDMLQKAPRDEVCGPLPPPVIIANKTELDINDLEALISLTGSYGTNTTVPYSAVVPGFWCELSPAQRSRSDHQNNRTWRLQSSTWDEHVLELTLPYSVSLAHVEFGFTLHTACSANLPIIQVTLLKQNLHGLGYKKDASYGSPVTYMIDPENAATIPENPVNTEEYLQAHNAEILAGPLLLSSGLDLTQQSGTLILTSPRLYRARGRTFLIHIKSLFDPAKDMAKGPSKASESSSKKPGFVGCDWLHQISLTVRASPPTDVPMERQQRIAMLESNSFLDTLCEIAASNQDSEKRKLALDLLIWTISIRLQRIRAAKAEKGKSKEAYNLVETQQLECARTIEKHTDALIKHCVLCSNRSIAKKCVKIMLTTSEGVKQLPKPWKSTFEQTLTNSVSGCIPYLGACESPGALRWLAALAQHTTQHASQRSGAAALVSGGLALLEHTARCLRDRATVYHQLLRARFGLYGLPLERTIFAAEVPELGRGTSTPVTYASVLAGDNATPPSAKTDCQLKDLLNLPPDIDSKSPPSSVASWAQSNGVGVFGAGLSEAMPLHVTCHSASDGTKLESSGGRHYPCVVSSMPGALGAADPNQLWSVVKEGQMKQTSQDPDSLEDVESSLMDCDPQEKLEFSEEKLFKEQEQCKIPWAGLVTRPPHHTLVVERMHSGARRYIVLDFGHCVRLTDVIIPSCSDLVTLCIDIWVTSEETDCVKLVFATDIATKHLLLTDIQPPPKARYMKITTIGRYGMSAMKCKIPLGWFYGEVAEIANVQASVDALNALHQDLACRFRLASGKLMDLLNPYLELYNGNAAHMMAYLNIANDTDHNVVAAYQECIELQQQLHTCNNILKKLQNTPDCNPQILELINKGKITSEALLERASTDKLTVISENVVDMLLYFFFQMGDVPHEEVSLEWCKAVCPISWEWGGRAGAALATLVARLCGGARWWGPYLADTLIEALADADAPPVALDRCLVLIMYMCRKSLFAQPDPEQSVAAALAERALALVRSPRPQPALTAAILTALAAALDAAAAATPANTRHNRWDWVSGGRVGGGDGAGGAGGAARPECKLHRRKLHKKLLHQMQELEAARRGIQVALEEQQLARFGLKARMAMVGKRSEAAKPDGATQPDARAVRPMPAALGSKLGAALVHHMLAADSSSDGDALLLCAKVVGRLCAVCGGAGLLEPASILGLAKLAVTLPPWPRHALTTLLQDLVEFESGSGNTSPSASTEESWPAAGSSRYHAPPAPKPRPKGATVADALADSFGLVKSSNFSKPKIVPQDSIKDIDLEEQLTQVTESDDSDTEDKLEQYFLDAVKKETRNKPVIDNITSVVSECGDARLESGAGGAGIAAEALARRALLSTGGALAAALRAPTPPPPAPGPAAPPSPPQPPSPGPRPQPPLTHTLYDVFRHLALEFHYQMDCTFMENVIALWLTLNGSAWGGGAWSLATLAVPADMPRVRLASDTVNALLHSLCTLENISLRCWVLSMQALAWITSLPLQMEGSTHTMGRVILECEHFVPAVVKFITMNVSTDGAVVSSEPYLGGATIGAGAGAASALHSVLSRVVCARGAPGALASLRIVASVWRRDSDPGQAYDLQATLLRLALSMLQLLSGRHTQHAVALLDAVAHLSSTWVRESSGGLRAGGAEARLSGLLADVLGGGGAGGGRRAPLRRAVLAQLLHYCRKLLAVPAASHHHPQPSASSPPAPGGEPAPSSSQTDESKAARATNVEDERKQAARAPTHADTVLQHPLIMQRFYRTLSMCDGMNNLLLNSGMSSETSGEYASLKEEVFWLVATIPNVAANPALMVPSLMDFLRKEEVVHLSQAMQQLIIRLLDKPEALAAFIEAGGLELAVEKLTACHQSGPSNSQGLVSSLMNYLKLPPQLINLSTPASGSKKNQPPVIETANGLVNIAPLCTVSCGNPTAQAADVLLEGGGGSSSRATCAARRVRAAAWSYHFFSADDTSLALTLTLPYAAALHELQLQPHLTSLATCPGAVGIEAGCGGTVAPLGPPQCTAGMTFIRLAVTRPVVCTQVQLRLYRPRDSSNMGLLQLRLLVAPAFSLGAAPPPTPPRPRNNWACVISACTRARAGAARWGSCATGTPGAAGAIGALCACVLGGGAPAHHAHHALLAAAHHAPAPSHRAQILTALLQTDAAARAHEFQVSNTASSMGGAAHGVCELVRQLCTRCPGGATDAYLQWLDEAARRWRSDRTPPAAARAHTLATVSVPSYIEYVCELVRQLCTRCPGGATDAYLQWLDEAARRWRSDRTPPAAARAHTLATVSVPSYIEYVCELVRQLCTRCPGGATDAYLQWLDEAARRWRSDRTPPAAARAHTLATVSVPSYIEYVCELVRQLCTRCPGGATDAYLQWLDEAARRWRSDRTPPAAARAHTLATVSVPSYIEYVCELVRQLCTRCPGGATDAYLQWLDEAARRWRSDRTPPAAARAHTLATVLWTLKEERSLDNLEELITDDLFELVYAWVKEVPESSLLKKSLDAILCSMCYIRPELFRKLLEHMDIPMDQEESMEGLTDDSKVHTMPTARPEPAECDVSSAWRLQGWQLQTVAAAAMSPAATLALLHSRLPAAVVRALAEFSEAKLELIKEQMSSVEDVTMVDSEKESNKPELPSMKHVCQLVEFARALCAERRLKEWLGAAGACFWQPLLTLLCYPRPPESTWQEGAQYAQLEEATIRLFAELNLCHAANQKLFAHTLHRILEGMHCTGPEGISGFTRSLILRLVLSGSRVRVALRWAGAGCACGVCGPAPAPPHAAPAAHPAHPAHPAAANHTVVTLPLNTTVRALLAEHRPPLPIIDDATKMCVNAASGGGGSVLRSASDTAMMKAAEAWELSLTAASAAKDKRVKDVKNTSLKHQNSKKRQLKTANEPSVLSVTDELIESTIRVQVPGLEGYIPAGTTLAQLATAAPHALGPHLTLTLHLNTNGEVWSGPAWEPPAATTGSGSTSSESANGGGEVLRTFAACGGLALVAARLPRPHAPPHPPPAAPHHHHDLDWVKLDDPYEEVVELGVSSASSALGEDSWGGGVPAHALGALGLLLKLPRYAAALLDEGARARHLLRLLLGVAHDEDGRSIVVGGSGSGSGEASWSLGTLPFRVVSRLLESAGPVASPEGAALRRALLALGAVRLVLACLAVFTHHRPASADNSQASNGSSGGKSEDKSQLYWAKGTGFGTGSTQQSWNVEQALVRQRTEEEHVTVLLQVIASYMNPGEKWPPEENSSEEDSSSARSSTPAGGEEGVEENETDDDEPKDLPSEFIDLIASSSLVPAICSYLRNDSVLDMSRHIPLYVCVLRCARALVRVRSRRLAPALRALPRLLHQMSRTTNSYAAKLRMSKKNIFGKMTYSQRFSTSCNSELSEEDEGLAALIADIQATSALVCRSEGAAGGGVAGEALCGARALSGASREARYIELMRTMQFETFEMIAECPESGFRFTVPYHFEGAVRAAGARAAPARMKRLAQEAATLATSLPLSYSSSVFVRTDTDRLDVMKVLITGPSDTPYANGCFILDVYFPAEYPAVPMLINLETTGRHSVRFNPNLYNDGKVCLSVLNTWHGRPEEKWNAHTSSFLQVLVSIQSLILVPEPYFNEPGYERSRGSSAGSSASLEYNSNIYQACARWAMLDHLRNPEPCFKEVIQTHFWIKRNEIMSTVAGWITELEGQGGDERAMRTIQLNLMALKRHYVKLQEELAKLPVPAGLEELDEPFRLPAAPAPRDHDMEKIVAHVLD